MSTVRAPSSLNTPIAILVHRLMVASHKLDLLARQNPNPSECQPEELASIVITREVAHEIDALYCLFSDHLTQAGLLQFGPLIDRFPEYLPDPSLEPKEEKQP
jgi:hypothetical protein